MEKIVLRNAKYKNLVSNTSIQKRMIFYNDNFDILVYQCQNRIILPHVTTESENEFVKQLHENVPLPFQDDNIEYILQLIDYEVKFERRNNKLKKLYWEIVRDYYCCFTELKSGINQKLSSVEIMEAIYEPKVISLEEGIDNLEHRPNVSQNLYGLNHFKQKVKEKNYAR